MATVVDPKTASETKPQVVPPSSEPEPEMFSAELAIEKRSYNFLPLLLVAALVVLVVGFIVYFVRSAHEVVTTSQATAILGDVIKTQGPDVTHFSVGDAVEPLNGQQDPLYKLLLQTGVITAKPKPKDTTILMVTLTGQGESLLSSIDGVQKETKSTGNVAYTVPLAQRKLLSIDKITLVKPHVAQVDYTWQWEPNRLGQQFDASSPMVKGFSTWERSTLIKSNGADFFSAPPTKASIILMEGDDGVWKPYRG
jgi:hypothetical protein